MFACEHMHKGGEGEAEGKGNADSVLRRESAMGLDPRTLEIMT